MHNNFWLAILYGLAISLAKLYGLANQKVCYIQMLLNTEKSVEHD